MSPDEDQEPSFVTLRADFLRARGVRAQLNKSPEAAVQSRPVHMDGVYQPKVRSMGGLVMLQYEYRVSAVAVANEDCTETVSAMQRLGNFGAGSDASGTAREILRYERPHPKSGKRCVDLSVCSWYQLIIHRVFAAHNSPGFCMS